jgi:hypothetical protein
VALAIALVTIKQMTNGGVANHPAPTVTGAGGVPRYYVAIRAVSTKAYAPNELVVGDSFTGKTLATFPAQADTAFESVTAAADDRTFVLSSSFKNGKAETMWYLLRITPGAAHPARLTQLPIAPLRAQVHGLALSQDGRELAVMSDGASGLQLSTYSVTSGALLGSWHTSTSYWILRTAGVNAYGLSWLADGRHIAFRFDAYAKNSLTHLVTERTLDVTAAGHDLLANSRLDLQLPLGLTSPAAPQPCFSSLATPDGRIVICGTALIAGQSRTGCTGTPTSFVSYSAATRERLRTLYQDPRPCPGGAALPLWTDSSGSQVIGLTQGTATAHAPGVPVLGLIVAGHFTPFPGLGVNAVLMADLGAVAF